MNLGIKETTLTKVKNIKIPEIFSQRMKTGIKKIDSLFDEGILPGSAFTLTAQAGCGKTTLMLQVLDGLVKNGYKVGYFSGEESIYQLAYTANRIQTTEVEIANETDIDIIAKHMEELDLVIVDSFQALTSKVKMNSRQLEKYAVQHLTQVAKRSECVIGFIMHLTKSGDLKGGTIVPHTVDANLKIEPVSNADEGARTIFFEKNRFGPLNELECIIQRRGYDFDAKVVKDDEGEIKKAPSKKARKKEDMAVITKMTGKITLPTVSKKLDDNVQRAQYLLRELTILGKLTKTGRGETAIWKKVK